MRGHVDRLRAGLLERGRERAEAEGLTIEFRQADAEALPFADKAFDAVVSTFGVMFTPNQERAAAEMVRVCKSGGKIGLANWTPDGFIGQLFKTLGKHVAPPAGVKSPALWGTKARIEELFKGQASAIGIEPRAFAFRYRSSMHFLAVFRTYYGPVLKAFNTWGPAPRRSSSATSSRWSGGSIAPATARWSCRATTLRSWSSAASLPPSGTPGTGNVG